MRRLTFDNSPFDPACQFSVDKTVFCLYKLTNKIFLSILLSSSCSSPDFSKLRKAAQSLPPGFIAISESEMNYANAVAFYKGRAERPFSQKTLRACD